MPIALFSMIVIFIALRKELLGPQPIPEIEESAQTGHKANLIARLRTIDAGGQILCISGFALVILALTWAGVSYSWTSSAVLAPLITGLALVVCFVVWERLLSPNRLLAGRFPWQKPMIPWALLTNRDVGLLFFTECTTGMAMFAVGSLKCRRS
jgi:hypothetical protein